MGRGLENREIICIRVQRLGVQFPCLTYLALFRFYANPIHTKEHPEKPLTAAPYGVNIKAI
jgi:hypothetical protein